MRRGDRVERRGSASALPAKSRSQRSSTKLKLIVSCQPRSASAWRSALAPRRDSLATFACSVPRGGAAGKRVVADERGSLPRSGLPRSRCRSASAAARRRSRPAVASTRSRGAPSRLRTRPASRACRSPWRRARRAASPARARAARRSGRRSGRSASRAAADLEDQRGDVARCARPSSPGRRRARSGGRHRSRSCSGASARRPLRATRTRPRRRCCAWRRDTAVRVAAHDAGERFDVACRRR